jgi:hypothetical protein|tara:strand:- start:948 stop:1589 length:642 start_codon:yes stop_codon:yes gene_type:complete
MGLTASKQQNTESLNWDKINTESMSTSIPNINNISKDANELISNLSINEQVDLENTDSDNENLFAWIKTIGDDKKENTGDELNTDSFSETSAFISSDMYKYLMNKNSDSATSNAQVGGGIQEDSSTSSTSSSPKKTKNTKSKKNKRVVTTSSSMSGGNLSYISSSAHTDSNNETNIISSSADYEESSISVGNNQMLTSSINTSDINLVEPNSE